MKGIDLKIKRIEAGVKQWVLAHRMGMPNWALSELENRRQEQVPEAIATKALEALDELRKERA